MITSDGVVVLQRPPRAAGRTSEVVPVGLGRGVSAPFPLDKPLLEQVIFFFFALLVTWTHHGTV